MAFKVICWGVGGVGSAAVRRLLSHPDFDVVGALVYSEEKVGKDIGTLVGMPECRILATNDKEKMFALDADVVIHTSRQQMTNDVQDGELLRLLESGKNVISCSQGYHNPAYGEAYADRYREACRRGNSSFYGVGINPGFMFERLVPTLTTLIRDIDLITFEEYIDLTHFSSPKMLEVMGFGMKPEDLGEDRPVYKLYERLFHEELNGAAQNMGITLDKIDYVLDYGVVDYDVHLPCGVTIEAGTVVAERATQTGYWQGKPFLTAHHHWLVHRDVPIWGIPTLTNWNTDDYWRIKIDGDPSFSVDLNLLPSVFPPTQSTPLWTVTSMTLVNAIPDVVAAPQGLVKPKIFAPWRSSYQRL